MNTEIFDSIWADEIARMIEFYRMSLDQARRSVYNQIKKELNI